MCSQDDRRPGTPSLSGVDCGPCEELCALGMGDVVGHVDHAGQPGGEFHDGAVAHRPRVLDGEAVTRTLTPAVSIRRQTLR
jgi:hypothetical protein